MSNVKLILKNLEIKASVNTNSKIGRAVLNVLPIISKISTWGDELYFSLPLNEKLDNPVRVANQGDMAYSESWNAFCVFYGKTPLSSEDKIIPNGPVEVIGKVDEDPAIFKRLLSGYFREKRRRMFNRVPILNRLVETIKLERF